MSTIDESLPIEEQCEKAIKAIHHARKIENHASCTVTMQPLSVEMHKQIHDGFRRHAFAIMGLDEKCEPVVFAAHDAAGEFAGAVVAVLFFGALHVKNVYVEDNFRGCGIGTTLMQHALMYGRNNGCSFAFVETLSFQALGFYQKIGFELEFTRAGFKGGTSLHYLRKDLIL